MIQIYHNPRCMKSRQTLALLEEHNQQPEIIKYLETPPSAEKLKELIAMLGIEPLELIRTNEKIWKEQFKNKSLTNARLIEIMIAHPKLIERPIVVKNGKAVLGRPPENVLKIL